MKNTKFLKGIGLALCSLILLVGCGQNNVASSSNSKVEDTKIENNKDEKKEVAPMKVEFETSEYTTDNYSTKYPASWTIQQHPTIEDMNVFLIGTQDEATNFMANVNIQFFDHDKKAPPIDTYVKELKKQSEDQLNKAVDEAKKELNADEMAYSVRDFEIEKETFSCGEVAKIAFSSTIEGAEVKQLQFHIFDKNDKTNYAIISYANVPQDFDKEVEAIKYMADTFKFKK